MRHLAIDIKAIFIVIIVMLVPLAGGAFEPDTYAPSSVLASGHWVKVKVETSGMYLIPEATLRSWGFNDPAKVRVFGYGGEPSSDILDSSTYIDDLPQAPSENTERGLVFYGRGPVGITYSGSAWSHSLNYYAQEGYYFLTDSGSDEEMATTGNGATGGHATFDELLYHESELVSVGSTGHTFLGEDFASTKSRTFSFDTPGRADDLLTVTCSFAAKVMGATSTVTLAVNDLPASTSGSFAAGSTDSHSHYSLKAITNNITSPASAKADVTVSFSTSGSIRVARLNYITVAYRRSLRLDGTLLFRLREGGGSLANATSSTRLWDVTDPARPAKVNATFSGGTLSWTPTATGARTYVAWNPEADMPSPAYVGTVTNQNIHADEVPDMVIITAAEWRDAAERLANLHRNDPEAPLIVNVYTQDDIFNEFSSGTPDINAFRRLLKMMWDRGGGSVNTDSKLRYALLLGRGIYDHRRITPEVKSMAAPILLQWQTADGTNDNTSYTTEDYLAFLRDGSGRNPGTDIHCIGVGRIPVTTSAEADVTVEKIKAYMADADKSDWKNRIVLACDDGDDGKHLEQMEESYKVMTANPIGYEQLYTKVYVDAFPLLNNVASGAHDRMFRQLNSGSLWWWYIGHANTFSWTGEGLLTMQDLDAVNFAHQPILYAATCDFLRWDLVDESGAEVMFFNPNGLIAAIAATRPVLISLNENMSLAMAESLYLTYDDGRPFTLGDILRNAKNSLSGSVSDTNKLRYVLLGDPALRPALSRNRVVLDAINDIPVNPDDQPTIKARENVTMSGRVLDAAGNPVTDFNGTLIPTLYDAEYSTTTLCHTDEDKEITFEEQGDRLYVGRETVKDGAFRFNISMPSEISYNFRPAALNLYAWSDDGRDASGVNRDFYVYGFEENADADTEAPVIEMFGLNSPAFRSGQQVNDSPTVVARVSDNVGINISNAGIGHQMSLLLDGSESYSDLGGFYEPGTDGPLWGTLNYPLTSLTEGGHTLRLRVWDTSNNYAEEHIDFTVVKGSVAQVIDIYADANPAIDDVNFYVEHNRPGKRTQVTLSVYDLMGRTVWTSPTVDGSGAPFHWDLTDMAGRRVSRGIYIYRAAILADGEEHYSPTRKIAVAAQ